MVITKHLLLVIIGLLVGIRVVNTTDCCENINKLPMTYNYYINVSHKVKIVHVYRIIF